MKSTEIIQKMITRDQVGDEQGILELQTELLQILRETNTPREISQICETLFHFPTIPAVPVLMGRLGNTQGSLHRMIAGALSILKTLIQPADLDPIDKQQFFQEQWWQLNWIGPEILFRQYLAILIDLQEIPEQKNAELVGDALAKELGFTLSPLPRSCHPGADLEDAMTTFQDAIGQEMLMCSLYSDQGISSQTDVDEKIRDLRADYLLTKYGLTGRFRETHALTSLFLSLENSSR